MGRNLIRQLHISMGYLFTSVVPVCSMVLYARSELVYITTVAVRRYGGQSHTMVF